MKFRITIDGEMSKYDMDRFMYNEGVLRKDPDLFPNQYNNNDVLFRLLGLHPTEFHYYITEINRDVEELND